MWTVNMQTALCTHHDCDRLITASDFELLPSEKIDLYRCFLKCPECNAISFYRKKTVDGRVACFGSRYHIPGCKETYGQEDIKVSKSIEIQKIIDSNGEFEINFNYSSLSPDEGYTLEDLLRYLLCSERGGIQMPW